MSGYSRRILNVLPVIAIVCASASARADDLSCTLSESKWELSFRDLPDQRSEFTLCLETRLQPARNELVHCQLYWQMAQPPEAEPRERCANYSYLRLADHNPFPDGDGEVCIVDQVTAAQAARGTLGWYYVDSAPKNCENLGPGAVFPLEHPEQFRVLMQCGIAMAHDEDNVFDIAPKTCSVPPSAANTADTGKLCSREVYVSEQFHSLGMGSDECATGVCLTTPLGGLKCSESGGIGYCGSSTTRCSCRCAGESKDDPGPFCPCPEDHECTPLLTDLTATPATSGSYCTPKEKLPVPRD